MNPISKAADVITFPARTAYAVASAGVRTTVRLLGWAAEQAVGQTATRTTPIVPTSRPTEPEVDPMAPTRTPPETVGAPAATAPARKVPASQVPLKSDPTPSLPRGVEAIDDALGAEDPAPRKRATPARTTAKKASAKKATAKKTGAKKTTAKKTATRKTAHRKAPSKQAAVLAPALGLSEHEVAEVVEGDTDHER